MFCSTCGSAVASGAAFCSACGGAINAAVLTLDRLKRPGIVTLLAVLQFFSAAFLLLIASAFLLGFTEDDLLAGRVFGMVFGTFAILQLACGIGLWNLKPYGRTFQIVFASIGLLAIPVGTIISICILIYMLKPGVKALFSGKAPQDLTPVERAELAAVVAGSTPATVLVIVLAVLGGVALIGIIAAIAIPGLLRARMAGNEAVAIGTLRAVVSAETSYAASAGKRGYAVSLAVLAAPCPGSSSGFISPDLAQEGTVKSGYVTALASAGAPAGPVDCNGQPTEADYYATSVPVTPGTTGNRAFSTSAAGTIFFDSRGSAPSVADTLDARARAVE